MKFTRGGEMPQTGYFGSSTASAVAEFKIYAFGGYSDYIVGSKTWNALLKAARAELGYYAPTYYDCPNVRAVGLSYGSRGDAVRMLQCLLNAGDSANLPVTGYYGDQTKAAVLKYKRKWFGPGTDSNIGPKTWQKLRWSCQCGW